MRFINHRDIFLLIFYIIIFITIRSLNFADSLNFSSDQGLFSFRSSEIFKNRELTLIGPPTSINFDGRYIFQGSIIYYFLLFFLWLGNFNPVTASYNFMIFCSLMIVPLFIGTKLLINKNTAWMMVLVYSLVPYFIDYTKFLWNPNFQLSLTPVLILLLGYYNVKFSRLLLFLVGIVASLILQFHYQYLLVLLGLTVYFIFKRAGKSIIFLFLGFIVGFAPLILFEVRNNFYNLQTLALYINNLDRSAGGQNDFQNYSHYVLSISLFAVLTVIVFARNIINKLVLNLTFVILLLLSLVIYLPKPESGFRMASHWNYPAEEKSFKIIKNQGLQNINVTNLVYDTKANVQKYLLIKEGYDLDYDDYSTNLYLYVIATNEKNISLDQAFEINSFKPFEFVNRWDLTPYHSLHLLKRS